MTFKRNIILFSILAFFMAGLLAGPSMVHSQEENAAPTEAAGEFSRILQKIKGSSSSKGQTELLALSEKLLFRFMDEYSGTAEASKARVALMQIYTSLGAEETAVENYDRLFGQKAEVLEEDRNTGLYFLGSSYMKLEQFEKSRRAFEELRGAVEKGSKIYKAAQEALSKLETKKKLRVGLPAIGFPESTKTISGKEISLKDYKGKVVLLDFWATWCAPCRREMPDVIDLYEEYHDDGFDIIGISMDQDVDQLKAYIEENSIPWKQIFDGQGWNSSLGKIYAVDAIPATFLLDREGRIYRKNLRGESLEEAVRELVKE